MATITNEDFSQAILTSRQSVSDESIEKYKEYQAKFNQGSKKTEEEGD